MSVVDRQCWLVQSLQRHEVIHRRACYPCPLKCGRTWFTTDFGSVHLRRSLFLASTELTLLPYPGMQLRLTRSIALSVNRREGTFTVARGSKLTSRIQGRISTRRSSGSEAMLPPNLFKRTLSTSTPLWTKLSHPSMDRSRRTRTNLPLIRLKPTLASSLRTAHTGHTLPCSRLVPLSSP
jgi:hypothetical protein